MLRISNPQIIPFSLPFSFPLFFSQFFFFLCPCSLNIIRPRHIRIPVLPIPSRHCPSLPRSTPPSPVDRRHVGTSASPDDELRFDILQLSRRSELERHFFPYSGISFPPFISSLPVADSLSSFLSTLRLSPLRRAVVGLSRESRNFISF